MAKAYVAYAGPIVTLEAARLAGLAWYFTGKPCRRGHLAQRYTANATCDRCRYENAVRNAAASGVRAKERRERDLQASLAKEAAYRAANRDKESAKAKRWYDANRDRALEISKSWKKRCGKPFAAAYGAQRRARKIAGGSYTAADVAEIGKLQRWKCHWCFVPVKSRYHVDHIIPLALGGSNAKGNICISCAPCNLKKHAKHPIAWAQENGRLL